MALSSFKAIPLSISQLSLAAVLKCGQSFRWSIFTDDSTSDSAEYRLCLKDRVICLRQTRNTLYYRAVFPDPQPVPALLLERDKETLEWLHNYFQLDVDLVCLYQEWAKKDKVFARFQERFEGIRILRQDPWENVISFICSSNNNIGRVTKMVQNLCTHYSAPLLSLQHPFKETELLPYHPFPSPSVLAAPEVGPRLRDLGFGYRADYIHRTAQMLVKTHGTEPLQSPLGTLEPSEFWLRQLRKSTTAEAREELLKFVGIGPKVADCILLMSLDKKEVVPVDTHVYQIAVKHYGMKAPSRGKVTMSPKLYSEVSSRFFSIWGEYAGWAHTVLFTADLKSFASYGLPTPSPSPHLSTPTRQSIEPKVPFDHATTFELQTPSLTPDPSPRKRKKFESDYILSSGADLSLSSYDNEEPQSSLADRIKKRKRKP